MKETRLTKEELWPKEMPSFMTNRINETIKYLENEDLPDTILDVGEYNPLAKKIEESFNVQVVSLERDFDYNFTHNKQYQVITCFEILEHLFNPLLFLDNLKKLLKESGVIYLSTPYQWPQIIKGRHHYHEIPEDRLFWLFDKAGLEVEDKHLVTIAGDWHEHIGFRPLLRYFQKTRIYKLKIKKNER